MNQQTKSISRNKLLGLAGTGWMFDAMDVGILSFVIAALAVEWNLTPAEMGWIGSVNSIGMAVGALGFRYVGGSDWSEKCIYDDARPVFCRKWFIRIDDDAFCLFSFTVFSRRRTWRRIAGCIDACI